jgi:phosphoglycerate dehydrogenase-like enzyme
MADRLLVADLAAKSKNWALTAAGEQTIRDAAPDGWRVHIVRAETSSDGDGPREPSKEAMDAMADAEIYFGFGVPRPLFVAAPKLKWVHSAAAGVGNSLYKEMMESSVLFSNSAGVHGPPIAEYVVASVMHFIRGIDVVVAQQRDGKWDKSFFVAVESPVREIAGATVLVVGTRGIGGQAAQRLTALGARCIGLRKNIDQPKPDGFESVYGIDAIDQHLPNADVVVLAAPLTPESANMFDAARLRRMKRGALLVNVARGALIDERALIDVLKAGHLRGAALDVFAQEPLAADSPLWQLRNVLVSPHISPVSPGKFWPRALEVFCDNWKRYHRGATLRNLVDKKAGY